MIEQLAAQFGIAGFSIYIVYRMYRDMTENNREVFNRLAEAINALKEEFKAQSSEFRELKDEILRLCGKLNGRRGYG